MQDMELRLTSNLLFQADKLTTLINAAKVPEVEPIWATLFAKVRSRHSSYPNSSANTARKRESGATFEANHDYPTTRPSPTKTSSPYS